MGYFVLLVAFKTFEKYLLQLTYILFLAHTRVTYVDQPNVNPESRFVFQREWQGKMKQSLDLRGAQISVESDPGTPV